MYISKETIKQAMIDLQNKADHMIKIWFVLKAMGLKKNNPVTIDTNNSEETLKRLFHSGSNDGMFYVPFAKNKKEQFMKKDAARSIIQTNVKKWMDETVSGTDPTSYLQIKKVSSKYEVSTKDTYPAGLGKGKNGFAITENGIVQIPMLQLAVWFFAQDPIPPDTQNIPNFLLDKLRKLIHLTNDEEQAIFSSENFEIKLQEQAISDSELFSLCSSQELENKPVNVQRILAAIRAKPFILLAGISGTGKTRLVRQLAQGSCPKEGPLAANPGTPGNYKSIPVRPNWHDSTELMGYITRITTNKIPQYVKTEFIQFLADAWLYEEEGIPFFLCLDEMNLAPVEQYFAEYLSVIETRQKIGQTIVTDPLIKIDDSDILESLLNKLYPNKAGTASALITKFKNLKGIPIPSNFVVMGTVNMDETTCSFSRKVLDRAMTFELNDVNMDAGLKETTNKSFSSISFSETKGNYTEGIEVYQTDRMNCDKILKYLKELNTILDKTPFKFAYRTRDEIMAYCIERKKDNTPLCDALDEATSMKILSRIEGEEPVVSKELLTNLQDTIAKELKILGNIKFKICEAKLNEMIWRLESGSTSFWT